MAFGDIVGQERAITVLRQAMRNDTVTHGYLFSGPEGVGKRQIALEFAKALNCLDAEARAVADSCGQCDNCRRINRGVHPDVREVTLYGRKKLSIGIGHIREPRPPESSPDDRPPFRLERDALLRPQRADRKVYLIDPADRMTTEAQNALLRLLEEPPRQVILVLITAQPAALLPTVLSRCQPLSLLPADVASAERHLIEQGVSPEVAAVAARLAGGRIGAALHLASPASMEARERIVAALQRLGPAARADHCQAALQIADQLKAVALAWSHATAGRESASQSDDEASEAPLRGSEAEYRAALPPVLEITATWFRDLLVNAAAGPDLVVHLDRQADLQAAAPSWPPDQASRALRIVAQARRRIERDANIDLVLGSMVLALMGEASAAQVWQA